MTKPGNTLEERLRALHDGYHGTQGCGIDEEFGCYLPQALRTAAAIGAELAFEEAASMFDSASCDRYCFEVAEAIRAAAQRARGCEA